VSVRILDNSGNFVQSSKHALCSKCVPSVGFLKKDRTIVLMKNESNENPDQNKQKDIPDIFLKKNTPIDPNVPSWVVNNSNSDLRTFYAKENENLRGVISEQKSQIAQLQLASNSVSKTLFEDSIKLFNEKIFRETKQQFFEINQFASKLKNDLYSVKGLYDKIENTRKSMSTGLDYPVKDKNPAKPIEQTEPVLLGHRKPMPVPKWTGYEMGDEIQKKKNDIRDALANNLEVTLANPLPGYTLKEWHNRFYTIVQR